MQTPSTALDGPWRHWVVIQPEPPGQFTVQVVGVLELRATAATREEALQQVRLLLREWLASGRLVPIETAPENPLLRFQGHLDPADPLEQQFMEELARLRREDFEHTLIPESDVRLDAWTELPAPSAGVVLALQPGPADLPDIPDIPQGGDEI
jgi:hypothetical protein